MRIKAAFFDLDNTLCDDASAWLECARKASEFGASRRETIDAERLATNFLAISEAYWISLEPPRETRSILQVRAEQWRQALRQSEGTDDEALAIEMACEYGKRRSSEIALFPDALETLAALRERGICLALITNGLQMTHIEKVERLGLEPEFDHVLIADAVGYFKPDRRIFEQALLLCGCRAAEAVMVGDDLYNDIEGARLAGITGFWYNPTGQPLPEHVPAPAGGELRTLRALLGHLDGSPGRGNEISP
jgi:putative hydrolase of the HAD superfamily